MNLSAASPYSLPHPPASLLRLSLCRSISRVRKLPSSSLIHNIFCLRFFGHSVTFLEYPQAYFSYPLPLLFYMFTCKTVPPRRHFYSAFTVLFFFLSSFFALPLLLCIVSCSSLFSRFPCHCHRINLSQLTLTLPHFLHSPLLKAQPHTHHPPHTPPSFRKSYNTKQPSILRLKLERLHSHWRLPSPRFN